MTSSQPIKQEHSRPVGKLIVGLAGGIGSGKSTVALIFGDLGAGVIASDRLNHEELNSPDVLDVLQEWWGKDVVGPDGRADRAAIRRIVDQDGEALGRLEQLMHPRVARRREELLARYLAEPEITVIVLDSPLLFEAGLADKCDRVVFVESDEKVRLERLSRERGWTREDLERFEKLQKSLDFKRTRADYIIENNSDAGDLRRRVEEVFSRILIDSRDTDYV